MQMCLQWVKYARQTPQQYAYALCMCVWVCVRECYLIPRPPPPSVGFLFALTLSERSEAGQGRPP